MKSLPQNPEFRKIVEKFAFMHSLTLDMHAKLSFEMRCLDLVLNLHLLTNSACANSKGCGEPVQEHRLTRSFTVCL